MISRGSVKVNSPVTNWTMFWWDPCRQTSTVTWKDGFVSVSSRYKLLARFKPLTLNELEIVLKTVLINTSTQEECVEDVPFTIYGDEVYRNNNA